MHCCVIAFTPLAKHFNAMGIPADIRSIRQYQGGLFITKI
jgi:hypothetical protein